MERYHLVDGDTTLLPGLELIETSGHVPGHMSVLIRLPQTGAVLLTVDAVPAGFGKTTLLSTWSQCLPANNPRVAWVSLDEEDNNPQLFWTYVLTALQRQEPEQFTSLLMQLQSPQAQPLKYLLAKLINMLVEGTDHFLLILDDYQVITEQQVHTTLAYLIEYLPPQLRIIVATRSDPPLPRALLRAHQQALYEWSKPAAAFTWAIARSMADTPANVPVRE